MSIEFPTGSCRHGHDLSVVGVHVGVQHRSGYRAVRCRLCTKLSDCLSVPLGPPVAEQVPALAATLQGIGTRPAPPFVRLRRAVEAWRQVAS